MSESVTNLSINFSNGGGAHTATVSSTANVKNPDGTPSLGFVEGDIGEGNVFSEDELNKIMGNFVLVEKSTTADPTKKTFERKYNDRTSMILNSYVVLVRGINAPVPQRLPLPDSDEAEVMVSEEWSVHKYNGAVPYFSEVYSDPKLTPEYGPSPPTIHNSAIIAGQIYNFEANAQFNGMKMSLVYQNRELDEKLSLNSNTVRREYLESPDLAQYNLKFGYTFAEFKGILSTVLGADAFDEKTFSIPDADRVLFETSGSLASVLSSIASYFGFYYYINPFDGKINFISSEAASIIPVEDPTQTSDERITSASFNESAITDNIINSYAGTTEKAEPSSPEENEPKMRASFFKRVMIEKLGEQEDIIGNITQPSHFSRMNLTPRELGAYFTFFNQGYSEEVFDKYTFLLLCLSSRTWWNKKAAEREAAGLERDEFAPNEILPEPYGPIYLRGDVRKDVVFGVGNHETVVHNPLYLPEPMIMRREPASDGWTEFPPDPLPDPIPAGLWTDGPHSQGNFKIESWGWGPPEPTKENRNVFGDLLPPTIDKRPYLFQGGQTAVDADEDLTPAQKNKNAIKIDRCNIINQVVKNNAIYFRVVYQKQYDAIKWDHTDNAGVVDHGAIDSIVNPPIPDWKPLVDMPRPSESNLYKILKRYFEIVGGIYISNGYSKYRAERMEFENMNGLTVSGPYVGRQSVGHIDDLQSLSDFFTTLGIGLNAAERFDADAITIAHLARHTGGGMGKKYEAVTSDEDETSGDDLYYFIGQKPWPKLDKDNKAAWQKAGFEVDSFDIIDRGVEFYEKKGAPFGSGRFIGGELGLIKKVVDIVKESHEDYMRAMYYGYPHTLLKLPYTRSKTRVNETNEEGQLAEDNALASGGAAKQNLAEIYDRYDLRSWEVVAPQYSLLSKPTLSTASGTTVEMEALKAARGANTTSTGNKLKTSSKTFYGLVIPKDENGKVAFSAITSSFTFSMGSGGITTTVGESTVKIIPPDQTLLTNRGMEVAGNKVLSRFSARQRNYFGL